MKLKMILGMLVMLSCDIFGMQAVPQKPLFLKAARQKTPLENSKQSVATHENNSASSNQGGIVSVDPLLSDGASDFQAVGGLDLNTKNNEIQVIQSKKVKGSLLKSQSPQEFFNNVGITLQELVASLFNMSKNGWRKVLQYLSGQPKTPATLEAIKQIEFVTNPMHKPQGASSGQKINVSEKVKLAKVLTELPVAVNKELNNIAAADQPEQAKGESGRQISPLNTQRDKDLSLLDSQVFNGKSKASVTVVSEQENFVSNQPLQTDGAASKSQPKSFASRKEITLVSAPVDYASSQPEVMTRPNVVPVVKTGSARSSVKNVVKNDLQAQEKSIIDKRLQEGSSLENQLKGAKIEKKQMNFIARQYRKKSITSGASDIVTNLNARIKLLEGQIKQEKINKENIKKQEGVLPGVGEMFKSKDSLMGRNSMSKSQPNKLDLSKSPNSIASGRDKITDSNPMYANANTKSSPVVPLADQQSLVKERVEFWEGKIEAQKSGRNKQGSLLKNQDSAIPVLKDEYEKAGLRDVSEVAGMNPMKSSLINLTGQDSVEFKDASSLWANRSL